MAYNNSQKNKAKGQYGNGRRAGDAAGSPGRSLKKYPVDRNFGSSDQKPHYSGRDSADRKPSPAGKPGAGASYGRKPYAKDKGNSFQKPSYNGAGRGGDRRPDRPAFKGKREGGSDRRPRSDWDKSYERIPPRNDPAPAAGVGSQASPDVDAEVDAEDSYDPTEGLVIGRNAVRELLRSERTVDKLLVHRGEREGSIVMLVAEAINRGIPVVEVDKAKLDEMAGFIPHQGVIAMVAQKEYCTVEDILALAEQRGEPPLIVIADGITDPYNLGALIRCAEGVGAHGLIIPRRRAVGLTALVAKSSAGAMEHLAVAKVSNIAATIKTLKEAGIWCYAAEAGGRPHYETDLTGPCALVFGSEGDGVSRVVRQACDGIVSIPMYGKVNSFNVSTAAAVILCEAARQQRAGMSGTQTES